MIDLRNISIDGISLGMSWQEVYHRLGPARSSCWVADDNVWVTVFDTEFEFRLTFNEMDALYEISEGTTLAVAGVTIFTSQEDATWIERRLGSLDRQERCAQDFCPGIKGKAYRRPIDSGHPTST